MLKIITVGAVLVFGSALAFGETFNGRLVDANCTAEQQTSSSCAPTTSTTSFALQVAGKTLRLDADGNRKAADALKATGSSADRAKEPNASSQVMAKVEGTLSGDEIKVDTVEIQ